MEIAGGATELPAKGVAAVVVLPYMAPLICGRPPCPLLLRPRSSSALKWLSGRRGDALIQFDCLALHVLSGRRGGRGAKLCQGGAFANKPHRKEAFS